MPRRIALLSVTLVIALGMGQLTGCSNSVKPPPRPAPLDPETELVYAPNENDTTAFRVHFYWNGFDRDGEVVGFYFAIDADTARPRIRRSRSHSRPSSITGGGPSPREGTVVGIQVQAHGLGRGLTPAFDPNGSVGRMVHLTFPLYFLRDQDAVRILKAAYAYVSASPTLP